MRLASLFLAAILVIGCNEDSNRKPVAGTVNIAGEPLDQGFIEFRSNDGGGVLGGAAIRDGKYALPEEKGLLPGAYEVRIRSTVQRGGNSRASAFPSEEDESNPVKVIERIPARYNAKTRLTATVGREGPQVFDFNLEPRAGRRESARSD